MSWVERDGACSETNLSIKHHYEALVGASTIVPHTHTRQRHRSIFGWYCHLQLQKDQQQGHKGTEKPKAHPNKQTLERKTSISSKATPMMQEREYNADRERANDFIE